MPGRGGRFSGGRRGSPGRISSVSRHQMLVASTGIYGPSSANEQEEDLEEPEEGSFDQAAAQNQFEQAASSHYVASSSGHHDEQPEDSGYEVHQDDQGNLFDNFSYFDEDGIRYDGEGNYEESPHFVSFVGVADNYN